jgi:hypothetical protein
MESLIWSSVRSADVSSGRVFCGDHSQKQNRPASSRAGVRFIVTRRDHRSGVPVVVLVVLVVLVAKT